MVGEMNEGDPDEIESSLSNNTLSTDLECIFSHNCTIARQPSKPYLKRVQFSQKNISTPKYFLKVVNNLVVLVLRQSSISGCKSWPIRITGGDGLRRIVSGGEADPGQRRVTPDEDGNASLLKVDRGLPVKSRPTRPQMGDDRRHCWLTKLEAGRGRRGWMRIEADDALKLRDF